MKKILSRFKDILLIILGMLVTFVIVWGIVSFALTLFARWQRGMSMVDNTDRFIKLRYAEADILLDTETNVQYLLKGSGMSILVDTDGFPILYEGGADVE